MMGIPKSQIDAIDNALLMNRIFIRNQSMNACGPSREIMSNETPNPKVIQVDGSHYKGLSIDPFEYCHRNGIGLIAGSAIKHITRYKGKGGKTDLLKAISEIQRLIEIEYPEK
jgi:hypothetical protein